MLHIDKLSRISGPRGSNPGGVYGMNTEAGVVRVYVKESRSNLHAFNEVLASKLYQLAGAPVINVELLDLGDGKLGTVTIWRDGGHSFDLNYKVHIEAVQRWFPVHAWLGNWDAIGLEFDNQVSFGGVMTTVDVGGSMLFRAMGGLKGADFGPEVKELTTMRNPAYPAGQVFEDIPDLAGLCRNVLGHIHADQLAITMAHVCAASGEEFDKSLLDVLNLRLSNLLSQ